jgi:hypothetical protein
LKLLIRETHDSLGAMCLQRRGTRWDLLRQRVGEHPGVGEAYGNKAGGKPSGCMDINTIVCYDAIDTVATLVDCSPGLDNDQYAVVGHVDVDRSTGKAKWDNVTSDLLPAITGTEFDGYLDFFWQIYNNHLRLLQLRLYPVANE